MIKALKRIILKYNYYILWFLVLILFLGLAFSVCLCDYIIFFINGTIKEFHSDALKILGGALVFGFGYYKYFTLKENEQNEFVKIELAAKLEEDYLMIDTKVENNVNLKKRIKHACLIINSENEEDDFFGSWQRFFNTRNEPIMINSTDDFINTKNIDNIMASETHAYIPLPFYYSENICIGNETVCFRASLRTNSLTVETRPYSIRMLVYSEDEHRHRTTHTSIILHQKQFSPVL